MDDVDLWLIAALLGLILAAAVLGAAEAALLRAPRVRIELDAAAGSRRSVRVLALIDDLPRVLNTVLLVVLLVQIGAASIAGALAARLFGSVGVTIASVVLTLVLFVYSEALPKTYAVAHPERVINITSPLLAFLVLILRPFVAVLMWFANLQAPGTGVVAPTAPTEEELLRLASQAADRGNIEHSDRLLIDRVFELGDRLVDEIYVPRLDVVAIVDTATVVEALDLAITSGHRRLPTYKDDLDQITGVVRMRDLAGAVMDDPGLPVADVAVSPLVVPESKAVVELLGEMQDAGIHFAVVVDEFGGTAGIVTIEDVVARLVGRISDEGEPPVQGITRIDETTWSVAGSADVEDFEKALGVELPPGDWNTIAGFMIGHLDHLPSVGETLDIEGVHMEVVTTTAHRITTISASVR